MEATLGDDIYQKSGFVKVSGFHLTDLSSPADYYFSSVAPLVPLQ